jgi:serine/threonine-protein kinase
VTDPELSSFGDFRLGDWLVQPRLNRIARGDSTVSIELKMMQVLLCLAKHSGDLVTRQELIDTVWATEFISENILTRAIAELRRVLGDDAKDPTYIETIHRRGYRLLVTPGSVSEEESSITRTVSHFLLLDHLGAGGMGVVYRAHDRRLDREVAIKVLPEEVARDEARLARFEREAKLLASLNHPNIATLYGLEEHRGQSFLVMELVDGETLAERIEKGPVSVDDALEIALQITAGLEAAHGHGIIHRDLKPANVMVDSEGLVKVLDFGLAKALDPEGSSPKSPETIAESPMLTPDLTHAGTVLGTAAYMSPEQARGKAVDKRADIWSFGCLLYEMLTGRRPFVGEDASETMAAILKEEPDWSALPSGTSLTAQTLLRRCLRKDPNRRLHDIADARIAIEEAGEPGAETLQADAVSGWNTTTRAVAVATAALGVIIGGLVVLRFIRPTPEPLVAVQINTVKPMPPHQGSSHIAVSPDGRHLVYVVRDGQRDYLVHRPMDQFVATPIPGSEGARRPFFSPDSQWVGFKAGGTLKKASLQGGNPVDLCEGYGGDTPTWSPAGDQIIFAEAGSLWRVPAAGGEATIVKQPDSGQGRYGKPEFLPDGRAVLVEIRSEATENGLDPDRAIGLLDLETLELQILIRPGSDPAFAPSGHIIFARGEALYAVAFDARRRMVSGEPTLVLEGVSEQSGAAQFSFSREGLLAYVEPSTPFWRRVGSLVWVDREGTATPLTERQDAFMRPRLSPNGTRVAVGIAGDIWIYEIETETWQLLTSDGFAQSPVWTPGGERIVFNAKRSPSWNYQPFSIPADFSGSAELLLDHELSAKPHSISPSGQMLLVENHPAERGNILMLSGGGGSPHFVVRTDSDELAPMVSPNGRWLAYTSDRSGVHEVFVEPFPGGGRRVQVSASGGTEPRWAPGGHELFYRNGAQMIAVPVKTESEFAFAGERQILFESTAWLESYDVDRDGQRFLMVQQTGAEKEGQIQADQHVNLILNWFEELKRLVPTE